MLTRGFSVCNSVQKLPLEMDLCGGKNQIRADEMLNLSTEI